MGKNSLKHTSNPPELTFSNHKYIASFGFVLRVYLTEINTWGLEEKLCKKLLDIWKNYWLKNRQATYQLSTQPHLNEIKDLSKAKGSEVYLNVIIFHLFLRSVEKVGECILFGPSANFVKSQKI